MVKCKVYFTEQKHVFVSVKICDIFLKERFKIVV